MDGEETGDIVNSNKIVVLLDILEAAAQEGSKMLLFTQSLVAMELIERVLDGQTGSNGKARWTLGRDYFRLKGATSQSVRQGWVTRFNDPRNARARLFIISTRAGGLGINLTAASRVVIFDASWNPSHDTQAIFRAYRFGQTRHVRVYRLLAHATMEEKIYNRQVNKNALASRVVDKGAERRNFTQAELDVFLYDPQLGSAASAGPPPDDDVLQMLLRKHQPSIIRGYHDHDSLMGGEAKLSKQEQEEAMAEYHSEQQMLQQQREQPQDATLTTTLDATHDESQENKSSEGGVPSASAGAAAATASQAVQQPIP